MMATQEGRPSLSDTAHPDPLALLQARLARLEDKEAIERLQYAYGYYIDNRMWSEMTDLFVEDGGEIEIGRRGVYVGKQRIQQFLHDVLGGGRWGLNANEIINHVQLQPLITVAADGLTAQARARAMVQASPPPGGDTMMWAEGLYENRYAKENGVWKIARLWWVPTFYVSVPGFGSVAFASAPESQTVPPDRPPPAPDAGLGRIFPPFHYPHPVTGRAAPLSVASSRE